LSNMQRRDLRLVAELCQDCQKYRKYRCHVLPPSKTDTGPLSRLAMN
jgi:hypothetical protein